MSDSLHTHFLISEFKDPAYFTGQFSDFFSLSKPQLATWIPDNYYWHGNEPDIHAVYLFSEPGKPDLTQRWFRCILKNKYENDYVGIDGNGEARTLSARYIFSSLGLCPIAGTDIYQLRAPLFKEADIDLGRKTLKITTKNFSSSNIHVKEVFLNGKPLTQYKIKHRDIENGGLLKFVMNKDPKM